ncbi:MAG: Calvin cycle protein CP12 [Cyanobacteria bacterium P01_A01_bin.135]
MPTPTLQQTEQDKLHEAIAQARQACSLDDKSSDCAAAWDIVEELQASLSHRRQAKVSNSLETYCNDNPDALECRVYDV